jgi:putative oxidoreductase
MATADTGTRRDRTRRYAAALVSTRPPAGGADAALAVVRLVLAWVFLYYGAQKLFGWWNGPGLDASATFFATTAGLRPGRLFAVVSGLLEFFGALALVVGVAVRVVGALLAVEMVIAIITVTGGHGFLTAKVPPGYELNIALAALAVVVALFGAGRYSVDAVLERRAARQATA